MARNRVDWTDPRLGTGIFEDMVVVLISRLYPGVQRIDGKGGDGGRDVQLPLPNGLEIFELKSFTGRLSKEHGRRGQVERSLKRAAALKPVAWHLVVPIDHTPSELKWFQELAKKYDFPCDWERGLTWLDDHMARHRDIQRYFLEGTAEEVVEILQELSKEQGALARGVPDFVERVKGLTVRLNGLDPFYSFGFTADASGSVAVTMTPRYVGAEHDRPVRLGGSFHFPDTEEGRAAAKALQDTFEYGAPSVVRAEFVKRLELDAPVGFGGTFDGGVIEFGRAVDAGVENLEMDLRILSQDAGTVAQLPLFAKSSSAGLRGGEIVLTDLSGALTVTLRLDAHERRMNLHYAYKTPERSLPGMLLPVLQFLAEMREGRSIAVLIDGRQMSHVTAISEPRDADMTGFLALVAAVDEIQRLSRVYFTMPQYFTDDELRSVVEAHRLLKGETLRATWSRLALTTTLDALAMPAARDFAEGELRNIFLQAEYVLKLGSREFPLGLVQRIHATAILETWPDVPAESPPETSVDLVFHPGSDSSMTISLVVEPAESSGPAEM